MASEKERQVYARLGIDFLCRHATDILPSKFHRKIKMNSHIAIVRLFLIVVALSETLGLPIADERLTGSDLLRGNQRARTCPRD